MLIPLFSFGKKIRDSKINKRYWTHLREIKLNKTILFLIAYWVYIDGVDTIIRMAINYGLTIGFDSTDLLIALLSHTVCRFSRNTINKLARRFFFLVKWLSLDV